VLFTCPSLPKCFISCGFFPDQKRPERNVASEPSPKDSCAAKVDCASSSSCSSVTLDENSGKRKCPPEATHAFKGEHHPSNACAPVFLALFSGVAPDLQNKELVPRDCPLNKRLSTSDCRHRNERRRRRRRHNGNLIDSGEAPNDSGWLVAISVWRGS